uniref:HMG box domain-containing protein n=1 Tax=Suricata suricatta TaxID=37032 RepID=A0A673UK51_SURSU
PVLTGLGVNDLGDPPNLLGCGWRAGPAETPTNRRPPWRRGGAVESLNNHQSQSESRGRGVWPGSSSCRGAENSAKQEAEDCVSDKPVHAGALGRKRLGWIRPLRRTVRKATTRRRPSPWAKGTPTSRGARCPRTPSSCRPAGRSTRRNTRTLRSISPSSPRNVPRDGRSAFFLFCSEHRPKIKSEHPGLSIGDTAKKLGEMWSEQSAKDKQPYEQKAAKLKEKYEKDIAAYRAKGKSEAGKKGPGRPTGSKKKNEPEDEEEEEEEEEDEDEEEEEEDEE